VIIPTYNRAEFLPRVLASVIGQTLPVREVILIDDGSTDRTREVVEGLLAERPEWRALLRYERQENQGKSVALNRGLAVSTGEWIAFDDSDDIWLPRKLELQLRLLGENPDCGACFSDARFVNHPAMAATSFARAGKSYPGETGRIDDPVRFIVRPPHGVFMQTVVVRRDAMRAAGEFDPRFRVSQDTDFLFRLALATKFCFCNQPLVEIDRTPVRDEGLTTHTGRGTRVRLETYLAIFDGWAERAVGLDAEIRTAVRDLGLSIRSELASWHIRQGNYAEARALLAQVIRGRRSPRAALKWGAVRLAPGLVRRLLRRGSGGDPHSL